MAIRYNNQTGVECKDEDNIVKDEYEDSDGYLNELHIVTNENNITINHWGGWVIQHTNSITIKHNQTWGESVNECADDECS